MEPPPKNTCLSETLQLQAWVHFLSITGWSLKKKTNKLSC